MILDKFKKRLSQKSQQKYNFLTKVDTPIYVFDLSGEVDNTKLVEDIYKFKTKFPIPMREYSSYITHVKAWHSDFATHKITDILDSFIQIQNKKIQKILGQTVLHTIWINIYEQGDSAIRHMHGINGWSTVYFPYVEEKPTPIIFDNNDLTKNEISIVPEEGMLLVFPSFTYHYIPNITENKRISIASNIFVIEEEDKESTKEFYLAHEKTKRDT